MIDPVIKTALTTNVSLADGVVRVALYNCIIAGRVKDKPTAELFVKALTDNKFIKTHSRRLREKIAQIDFRYGAFGPDSSYWLHDPSGHAVQAANESRRVRQALPDYTTNRR